MSAQHAAAPPTAEIPASGTGPTQLLPPVAHLRTAATGEIPQIAPGWAARGTAARPEWPDLPPTAAAGAAGPGRTLTWWWLGRRSPRHPIRHHAARRVPMVRHRAGRVEPYTRPIPVVGRGKAPRHRRGGPWRAVLVSLGRMLRLPVVVVPLALGWGVGLQVCIEAVAVWPW